MSIHLIPKHTPKLSIIVDDLACSPAAAAAALGVSERTLKRWLADDEAPRAACLALYWVSRWGLSALDCHLHQAAQIYGNQVRGLERELQRVRGELARVLHHATFESANAPTMMAPGRLPLVSAEVVQLRPRRVRG